MLIAKFKKEEDVNLEELKERIGCELPEQYKKFILKYNVGETPNTDWPGKCKSDVRGFYGIDVEDENYDFFIILKYTDELLEKGLLVIAKNVFGDHFCIKLEDGTIWFVYHDANRKVKIADCFNDFIKKCKSKKLDERMKMSVKEREEMVIANGHGDVITDALRKSWQDQIDYYESLVQEEVELD